MKVKELIERLSELNQDAEVYLSSDQEGNTFLELFEVVANRTKKAGSCATMMYNKAWDYEEAEFESEEEWEEFKKNNPDVVILWP